MENTKDKSFASHNSDKLFIRTMEDDLKKIRNNPAVNNSAASIASSASFRSSNPFKEINRPVLTPTPISASIPASTPVLKPNPIVPKNLPIDISSVEKKDPAAEAKAETLKPIEKIKRESAAGGEEKTVSIKARSAARLIEEAERLSPEARLARQSTSGINDSEIGLKRSHAIPPTTGIPSVISMRSDKLAESFNPVQPAFSSKIRKKTIEEIIEEDSSGSFFKKFIRLFFSVLVIAGIGIGAYYLYIAKKPAVNPFSSATPANIPASIASAETFISGATEAVIKADLNTDLSDEIKLYFSSAMPSGIYRLILKDKDGQNSLALENFSKSLNILLPGAVAGALEKNYNLIAFNYPERNYLRLGLVLKVKNSLDIFTIARNWEPDMHRSVEAVFLGNSGIYDPGKQFGSNAYNNFEIRYLPLGADAALNYAIDADKKFLLIAASKQDIFSLIDKIIKGK